MNYVEPDYLRPGSDTRIRQAAEALSHDLRAEWWCSLRELQWTRPSAGGLIFDTPQCYRQEAL